MEVQFDRAFRLFPYGVLDPPSATYWWRQNHLHAMASAGAIQRIVGGLRVRPIAWFFARLPGLLAL